MKVELFIVTVIVCSGVSRSEKVIDHRFFLWQIMDKYGYNGTIPYNGFERLYKNLGLGNFTLDVENDINNYLTDKTKIEKTLLRNERGIEEGGFTPEVECTSEEVLAQLVVEHKEVPVYLTESEVKGARGQRQCLSPRELLVVYGLQQGDISAISFLHLCPAIVYQLDQGTCQPSTSLHKLTKPPEAAYSSWMYACLTVVVISISGLLCVSIVPLLQKTFFNQLISFLVSLAVGTLLGDAFLHLIPHALGSHKTIEEEQSDKDSIMKTGLMFLTVVFFFMLEAILNNMRTKKEKKDDQKRFSYTSVEVKENENEMMEIAGDVGSHQHSHSHTQGEARSNTVTMVIVGDGLHNLTDGLAIGAAFSGGLAPGFATAVAVFTHELPHELGDFAVMIQSGMRVRTALFCNMLSSILSCIGTVIGLVVGNFGDSTRWVYAITAGSFIYIALSNLVPEINRQKSDFKTIIQRLCGMLCGGALMGCIALYEHDIQHLFT